MNGNLHCESCQRPYKINAARINAAFTHIFPYIICMHIDSLMSTRSSIRANQQFVLNIFIIKNKKQSATRFRMFALLRSLTESGSRVRTFEILQWDENEDNQVFVVQFTSFFVFFRIENFHVKFGSI